MQDTTKVLSIVGSIVAAGAAVALLGRRSASPFYGLPPKPWHASDIWDQLGPEQRRQAEKRWYEKAGHDIMSDVADLVNVMGEEESAGRALGAGLYRQHRTLQQSFFRALPYMLNEYVRLADQFGTDLRNEAAVNLARKLGGCAKEPLPFI